VFRAARVLAGVGLFVLLLATTGPLSAQPTPKKVLTFADENLWRTSSAPVMSPDGSHVAYTVSPTEGDGESIVRHVASGKEFKFPRGGSGALFGSAKFTPDSKRVLLVLTPTKAELDKAKADKVKTEDMPQPTLAVVDLATGTVADKFPQSGLFSIGGEGAGFVVYRKPAKGDSGSGDTKTGPPTGFPGKGKFGFPPKGGAPGAPGAPTTPGALYGSDLLIRDIATKAERTIPDVSEFNLTRDGKLLVYAVASRKDETNGVFAINPRGSLSAEMVKGGPGRYSGLTWDEKQAKLAFLFDDSAVPDPKIAPPPRAAGTPAGSGGGTATPTPTPTPPTPPRYRAFVWDRGAKPIASTANFFRVNMTGGASSLVSAALTLNPLAITPADEVLGPTTAGLRSGWAFNGGSLSFSADGTKLFVNTAPKRESTLPVGPPRPDDFQLDLWHWKDERLQPMQKLQAASDQAKTYSGVVLLDTKQFRQLSDETVTVGQSPAGSEWAIGSDNRKYRGATGYGLPLSDYAAVNVRTGETKSLLPGFGGYTTPAPNLSPTGKHLVAFDGKDWFTVSVPDGKKANLTASLKLKFHDEDDDHPGAPPPAGQPLWTTDGKFVLVNDRYDLWKLAADGSSAENLTKIGRAQQMHFTLLRVPAGDELEPVRGVDLSKPHLLGAENLHTRDTGFYRLEPGAKEPKLLIMGPRRYGSPTKAKNADVFMLTVQTFSTHPDYFVTGPDFHELKRVTDINPRVKEFNWGKAELVHYTSTDGVKLSGVLVKPENFDPSKKYPMVVYIYERLSDSVHTFRLPVVRGGQVINPTFYASNGYLVLMPDIAYKVGTPGQSALRCVLPAIQAVCDKGYVDENAIGINGQSWGGYQIAYMVTQTDRFKAAVAGAAVTNMTSAYGGIRWGTGLTRQFQYEWTQSRIGATLWEAPMKYLENSPVFMADRVKTPLLMINNDADDAVPWYQGIEMYLAMRRLEKECYMLNYNGQPHNLSNRAAARDFSVRMFQFFEHYLRGKPEPTWMAKGVPYLDREKDKEEIKKLLGPEKK
jgi:dipeptidyl aminopeptidase/acylaminoacyl peptidase